MVKIFCDVRMGLHLIAPPEERIQHLFVAHRIFYGIIISVPKMSFLEPASNLARYRYNYVLHPFLRCSMIADLFIQLVCFSSGGSRSFPFKMVHHQVWDGFVVIILTFSYCCPTVTCSKFGKFCSVFVIQL